MFGGAYANGQQPDAACCLPAGMQNLVDHMDEAQQMVHEMQTTFIGIATDVIIRNTKFLTDYRRGLTNIGMQCSDVRCMSILGLIGTALGYTTWLELCASILVLLIYFFLKPAERVAYDDLTAIITAAPVLPSEVNHSRMGDIKLDSRAPPMERMHPGPPVERRILQALPDSVPHGM
jgi:hypothetical protein